MTTVEKSDKVLYFLEGRAAEMGYDIDADERYIAVCGVVTELDMGRLEDTPRTWALIRCELKKLIRCICPKEYEIFGILFMNE